MMDRGTVQNMQFYSKNKFEKLVHPVGFIIRIYHNARSTERHINTIFMTWDSRKLTAATVLVENKMRNRVRRGSLTTMYCNAQFYILY